MSSEPSELAVELVRRDADACVLAVSGELSLCSAGLVTRAVSKALLDVGRVLVDVSGLRLTRPSAAQLFPTTLTAVGGWPGARLVLFGVNPELARSLTAMRVAETVPLASDEAAARRLLERRPPAVARYLDLNEGEGLSLPRRARLFVKAACAGGSSTRCATTRCWWPASWWTTPSRTPARRDAD
jgi:anti-anti-sigma regulatory factor